MPASAVVMPGTDRANCSALTESFFSAQSSSDIRRQIPRELTLQQRRARNQSNLQGARRLHHRHRLAVDHLIGTHQSLGHGEIQRQLHEAEVMLVAAGLARDFLHAASER